MAHLNSNYSSIELVGSYQGKNLYVQTPQMGTHYCAVIVFINGKLFLDSKGINVGAFEVDLMGMVLKMDAALRIQLFHHLECRPKVLNPEILHKRQR
ncbi:MAG: hypothetical protein ACI837_002516 [Crocinitomicaceae bacterium]|jgi:hypothetical protein